MLSDKIIKKVSTGLSAIIIFSHLAGCASSPDTISAAYVSPLQYSSYSCNQTKAELMRVNRKVMEVTGAQEDEANKDAVAVGVGLVLFWPALFFLMGDDRKDELARLKGEYEALETVAIQKECDIAEEIKEAQKQRMEYKKMRQEQYADPTNSNVM